MHDLSYVASDPYMDTDRCIARLLQEWRLHGKLIIACDFDDTVFDFHSRGHLYTRVLHLLQRCQEQEHWIMLYTAMHPDNYAKSYKYLLDKGIAVHCVNKNPIDLPFGHHGKPLWSILLDDRAGLGQAYVILSSVLAEIDKEKGKTENEDVCAASR